MGFSEVLEKVEGKASVPFLSLRVIHMKLSVHGTFFDLAIEC